MTSIQSSTQNYGIAYKTVIFTYLTFVILVVLGHVRDQLGKIFTPWKYRIFSTINGVPPLFTTFESFYVRRLYQRISDCWSRPIIGIPGTSMTIKERISFDSNETFQFTGKNIKVLNFGSYNYLGFSINSGPIIEKDIKVLKKYGFVDTFRQNEFTDNHIIAELQETIARFLFSEAAIVYQMGYGTNLTVVSDLMNSSVIFSDEFNHMSLINGMKLTNSEIVIYKHNDMADLETKLIEHISHMDDSHMDDLHMDECDFGLNSNSGKNNKRIFVVCEGIFSMEGTVADLRRIVELKKKYKFYIYLDEAHSIGAIGRTGRGVCEYLGIDPKNIDIQMGTFSKSFGGFGGYIAGSKKMIDFLRCNGVFARTGEQMSYVVANHILESLKTIISDNSRVCRLNENTRHMRELLKRRKFYILGDENSPVIPILIFNPGKIAEFSRMCQDNGLGVVVVGFPATPILYSRVRICVSASHTFKEIEKAVEIIDGVGTLMGMKSFQ